MSGFYQIELEKSSRDITSFSTNNGSYRFKRLPFGLEKAPNTFQGMMPKHSLDLILLNHSFIWMT